MESGFEMEVILEYSKVFENGDDIDSLLSGISRKTLLKVSSFFLGFSNKNSKYDDPKEFISMYFQEVNNGFANVVYRKIKTYQENIQKEIRITNTLTSLTLFEYAFQNLDEIEILSQAEIEVNIFKAYLLINEQHELKARKALETVKATKSGDYLSEFLFTLSYADSDLINFDSYQILVSQLIKAVMLFEMLEKNKRTRPLLNAFLKYFECDSWKEYINRVLPIIFMCIEKTHENFIEIHLEKDENYKKNIDFFKKLIITNDEGLSEHDFTSVRANPIYQVGDNIFRIVFPLFAIEMLFKGLYFKLAEINHSLSKEEGGFPNLRSYYCENFSENYLLYETINRMYGKRFKKFTGVQMKSAGLIAEPDYYIRNGNKIFIFESKDVLIRDNIKTSFDYELLIDTLKEKFYFVDKGGGKVKNKAILQIINTIKNTLDKTLIIDSDYNKNKVIIYPILITHHHQFDVVGLNNILNNWFDDELDKLSKEGYKIKNIRPLTLINIDDLILNQDFFANKVISLDKLIEGYINHKKINKKKLRTQEEIDIQIKSTLVPFSIIISKYTDPKSRYVLPKILKEKGVSLFQ